MAWYQRGNSDNRSAVRLNRVEPWARSAYWMVCLEVDASIERKRDEFIVALKAGGINSRPYFCTLSSMPMYRQPQLPVSAKKAQVGLNLPSAYELTKSDVRRIGSEVNELLRAMCPGVTTRLGVVALVGPDNGGT